MKPGVCSFWTLRIPNVLQNNLIYKGYRLTARVFRGAADGLEAPPSGPTFVASITVAQAAAQEEGEEYAVPRFAEGGFVYSPREAVHAAIVHGREIVDGLTAAAS